VATCTVIITEALQKAGAPHLSTRAIVWLNAVLESLYASWDWPFLKQRYGPFTLAAGINSFEIGDGTLTSDKLQNISRVRIGDTVNTGLKADLLVDDDEDVDPYDDPLWANSAATGLPRLSLVEVAISASYVQPWRWLVSFDRYLDKSYRVVVRAKRRPADMNGTTDVPLYPGTNTLIQAIYVEALRDDKDERWRDELNVLNGMIAEDRVKYGRSQGSQVIGLSRRRFKR
jgi:hypothetical protein